MAVDVDRGHRDGSNHFGDPHGASSIVTVGAGIAQIWFERGPAELALGHWEASQGRLHESLDRPRITPIFAPTRGGATAGVRLDL